MKTQLIGHAPYINNNLHPYACGPPLAPLALHTSLESGREEVGSPQVETE